MYNGIAMGCSILNRCVHMCPAVSRVPTPLCSINLAPPFASRQLAPRDIVQLRNHYDNSNNNQNNNTTMFLVARSAVTLRQDRCGSDIASGPSSRAFPPPFRNSRPVGASRRTRHCAPAPSSRKRLRNIVAGVPQHPTVNYTSTVCLLQYLQNV